jgi:hypothetical protein
MQPVSLLKTILYALYYFELKMHLSSHFSELKIRVYLKFEVVFFTESLKNMIFLEEQVASLKY